MTSHWAGEEEECGVDCPASPCQVTVRLCREALLSMIGLGKTPAATPAISTGEPRLLLATLRVPSDPAPPSSDGSACRAPEFPRLSLAMPTHSRLQFLPIVHVTTTVMPRLTQWYSFRLGTSSRFSARKQVSGLVTRGFLLFSFNFFDVDQFSVL